MKTQKISLIGWMVLSVAVPCLRADNATLLPYLGQEPPGLKPKVFAPGIISLDNREESFITFSPDGNKCYFAVHKQHGAIAGSWRPFIAITHGPVPASARTG